MPIFNGPAHPRGFHGGKFSHEIVSGRQQKADPPSRLSLERTSHRRLATSFRNSTQSSEVSGRAAKWNGL